MKVLIVDDEPIIRLGLSFQAADWGYEVLEAANADDAIRLVEANPDIRLLLTDVDMPGSMDGIKLAHFVKQRWPPISIIVVSGKLPAGEATLSFSGGLPPSTTGDELLYSVKLDTSDQFAAVGPIKVLSGDFEHPLTTPHTD